jgi:hypothetical protein
MPLYNAAIARFVGAVDVADDLQAVTGAHVWPLSRLA